jgi:hypothetical protein
MPLTESGAMELLTDPFLQQPNPESIEVAWFTEFRGDTHHVVIGEGADERVFAAQTIQLSRVAEDVDSYMPADRKPAAGIVARDIYRHHAVVTVAAGTRTPYRVVSVRGDEFTVSDTFTVPGPLMPGEAAVFMLTSDHQLTINTPANLEFAARVITEQLGPIDAVFMPGDLVNVPDRASEWFDDERGSAFFPSMQGRGGRVATDGAVYRGGQILQHAPLFPAIGNHEVQGRRDGHTSLTDSFDNAVPRAVAEVEYGKVCDVINPAADPAVKAQWIENNSFSTTTYEEIFSLPRSDTGAKRYYATTVGDVRLIALFATRVWRSERADPRPATRDVTTRHQESRTNLTDPLRQGHGDFIFDGISVGSQQYEWLRQELDSPEFREASYTVVMLHEGPHSLGENASPPFAHPLRVEENDDDGQLIGIRYDYPVAESILLRDVLPLLEDAEVDLVYNGHSHLWNRFASPRGVNYLEASNTGNSFGAFLPVSGARRPIPPAPWHAENHLSQGNPGGLDPVPPTIAPLRDDAGRPLPYVADDNLVVFQALDTGTGTVTSWYVDMADTGAGAVKFDEFPLKPYHSPSLRSPR